MPAASSGGGAAGEEERGGRAAAAQGSARVALRGGATRGRDELRTIPQAKPSI